MPEFKKSRGFRLKSQSPATSAFKMKYSPLKAGGTDDFRDPPPKPENPTAAQTEAWVQARQKWVRDRKVWLESQDSVLQEGVWKNGKWIAAK